MAESITEVYNSEPHFRNLLTRLSIPEAHINRLINEEGLNNASELAVTKADDIEQSMNSVNKLFGNKTGNTRLYFSPARIKKIVALAAYFKRCQIANRIPDIRQIFPEDVNSYVEHLNQWKGTTPKADIALNKEELKFDFNRFISFREKIQTLVSSINGCRGISLEYLLRPKGPDDTPRRSLIEDEDPQIFSNEFMLKNATLSGPDFNQDNEVLYIILRHYLTGTAGWNIISKFSKNKNGRGAYLALRNRYESPAYNDALKTQANSTLTTTFYKGDNTKFNWEKFVSLHMEAHRKFEEINEPLPESMKILHLKTGIRPEAGLEAELAVARAKPEINTSFDAFVTQITEGIANRRSRQGTFQMTSSREVSSFNTTSRGRGRARGSGRGTYHGGVGRGYRSINRGRSYSRRRGRGRNSNSLSMYRRNNSIPSEIVVEGKTLYPNKDYSAEEYNSLSYNQKGSLRRARVGRYNESNNTSSTIDSRTVKATTVNEARDYFSGNNNIDQANIISNESYEGPSKLDAGISATQQIRKRRRTSPL